MIAPVEFGSHEALPTLPRGNAPAWATETSPPEDNRGTAQPPGDISPRRRFWLRVLFALDVAGAGGPGLLMLAAPRAANDLLFAGGLTPDAGTRVLGCVWLALGLLSIAGLVRPLTFSPVLLVQFGYKLLWLLTVALPSLAAGDAVPPLLTAIFAAWVVAVGLAAPWRALFEPELPLRRDLPRLPR